MRGIRSLVVGVVFAFSVATVAWAAALPAAPPEHLGLSAERLARIGAVLTAEIERGQFPGAVALVARKGRIAYFDSFGLLDKASGSPMTKEAIFRIYSMTKPITSVATMMLVEEGRLVLTDPVSKFLPPLAKLEVSVQQFDPATGKASYSTVPAEREMKSAGTVALMPPIGFGLGFAVRKETGLAGVPGSAGEYYWAGAAGTGFWVDPKEELICIFMTQAAPGAPRRYDRQLFKQFVYQAIND